MVKPPPPDAPRIVVGRTRLDYLLCGKKPEKNTFSHACHFCNMEVIITAEGEVVFNTPGPPGCIRIVSCSPCVKLTLAKLPAGVAQPLMTKHAVEQAESSPSAKRGLDDLLGAIR